MPFVDFYHMEKDAQLFYFFHFLNGQNPWQPEKFLEFSLSLKFLVGKITIHD
jgi:hypothetical protein